MTTNKNVETVRAIGKGARLTETAVAAIVAALPEGFDPNKRGAISDRVHVWAGFADKSSRPAVTTGSKGNQTPTDYGTGVDTITRAVRKALNEGKGSDDKSENMLTAKGVEYLHAAIKSGDTDAVLSFLAAEVDRRKSA